MSKTAPQTHTYTHKQTRAANVARFGVKQSDAIGKYEKCQKRRAAVAFPHPLYYATSFCAGSSSPPPRPSFSPNTLTHTPVRTVQANDCERTRNSCFSFSFCQVHDSTRVLTDRGDMDCFDGGGGAGGGLMVVSGCQNRRIANEVKSVNMMFREFGAAAPSSTIAFALVLHHPPPFRCARQC